MKLKSGHEVKELPREDEDQQKKLFKGYKDGVVRLQPGNWFYTRTFLDFADRIYDFKFKPTDTIVMTFPKCGTTWMQQIVWNMKYPSTLDEPPSGISINVKCPFIEADFLAKHLPKPDSKSDVEEYFEKYCSGEDPKDGVFIKIAKNIPDPRIIKTHLPFSLLPPNLLDTCKVVFVVRNPKDACISFYHHSRIINAHNYVGDFDTFLDLYLKDEVLYGPYWKFMEEGWYRKKHPHFFLVNFEDLKSDPVTELSYLNDFLETGLSEELIKRIADETVFEKMKAKDPFSGGPDSKTPFLDKSKGSFFRSGKTGGWKDELTKEQNQKMDKWIQESTKEGKTFEIKY